jgi:hypothetical protein
VSVKVTGNPSAELPGSVIGQPVRIPAILLCTQGERFCGRVWVANTVRDLPVKMTERRRHEEKCSGGLVVATSASPAAEPDVELPWWAE